MTTLNYEQDNMDCPICGNPCSWRTKSGRKYRTLEAKYDIYYTTHICTCGNAFSSYDAEKYPPREHYGKDVRDKVIELQTTYRLKLKDIQMYMESEYDIKLGISTLKQWSANNRKANNGKNNSSIRG